MHKSRSILSCFFHSLINNACSTLVKILFLMLRFSFPRGMLRSLSSARPYILSSSELRIRTWMSQINQSEYTAKSCLPQNITLGLSKNNLEKLEFHPFGAQAPSRDELSRHSSSFTGPHARKPDRTVQSRSVEGRIVTKRAVYGFVHRPFPFRSLSSSCSCC